MSDILNIYCAISGYMPDECVGAEDKEMLLDIYEWIRTNNQTIADKDKALAEAQAMLKMKQDDWIEVCKENDELQAKVKELEGLITLHANHIGAVDGKLMMTEADLADAQARIKELESEQEKLVWNLAGISTICCAEQPSDFNGEWARPALHDANKLATKYVKLEAKVKELEKQVEGMRNCSNCEHGIQGWCYHRSEHCPLLNMSKMVYPNWQPRKET